MLVQPEHILSLRLMAIDFLASGQTAAGNTILKTLHMFHTYARNIVDECDENFSVKFELVYTMGVQRPLDFAPERWRIILAILRMLPDCASKVKKCEKHYDHIDLEDQGNGRFPKLRFLSAEASNAVMDELADRISRQGFHGLPVAKMSLKDRESVRDYVRNSNPAVQTVQHLEDGAFQDRFEGSLKQLLLLVRGLIAEGVLSFAFASKRWRVNFGPDPNRKPMTRLAVPYRAKDCPTARSEYSHPDVVIALTAISHYYAGLSDDELFLCFEHMLKSDQAAAEYSEWVKCAPTLPDAHKTIAGVNIKDHQQCINVLFPCLKRAAGAIDYFLSHIVFPKEIREFPNKLDLSFAMEATVFW